MMPTALLPFFHWLRLTRPWNVLAMGGMVWIVMRWLGSDLAALWHLGQSGWIVVPMLVGAAGNLINDYFDVREDRINKPNRALVGRLVKRRVLWSPIGASPSRRCVGAGGSPPTRTPRGRL